MPDFDFIGFTKTEKQAILDKAKPRLVELEFANDLVIIDYPEQQSRVTYLVSGKNAPFLRIYTRCQNRARILTDIFKQYCDVEIIYIGMFEAHKQVGENVAAVETV